jgi:hypothetical protein
MNSDLSSEIAVADFAVELAERPLIVLALQVAAEAVGRGPGQRNGNDREEFGKVSSFQGELTIDVVETNQ